MITKDTIRRLRNWQIQHAICEENPKLLSPGVRASRQ
jgi:hypothetical protein